MRILIYTGKGGVGKTSVAAATAVHLAHAGKKVLVMSTDPAHSLSDALDRQVGGEATEIFSGLFALEIDTVAESRSAWGNLQDYLKQILSDKANGGIAADEVLLFPGLEELFSLLKILDVCEEGRYDVMIVDCAPTGETLSLLRYPEQLAVLADKLLPSVRSMNRALGGLISRKTQVPKPRDLVFEEFDRLVKRLDALQKILRDREITTLRLVTTPERIVLEEARRSYTWMNAFDFGVDAVYVNKIYPKEAMQGYFGAWLAAQEESLKIAAESFADAKLFDLPLQAGELRGVRMLAAVGEQLYEKDDPVRVFCKGCAFRMEDVDGTRFFIVSLPHAKKEEIAVEKQGENLVLTVRNQKRRFHLPAKVSRRKLSGWDFTDGELRIRFDYD